MTDMEFFVNEPYEKIKEKGYEPTGTPIIEAIPKGNCCKIKIDSIPKEEEKQIPSKKTRDLINKIRGAYAIFREDESKYITIQPLKKI